MNLFVYEHITSGALSEQSLPDSLANEGHMMLMAVLRDCINLEQLSLSTMRDHRLTQLELFDLHTQHVCHFVSNPLDYTQTWQHCLDHADAILIIAPESDNTLAHLQQQALAANKIILGCLPNAIQITSNKYLSNQALTHYAIPVISTTLAMNWGTQSFPHPLGYIVKPIDGAGCIDTYWFKTAKALAQYLTTQDSAKLNRLIIQPYLEGISASLSLLVSDDDIEVLAINQQHITTDQQQLKLMACSINADAIPFTLEQAQQLAQQIHLAIPGLWGHIGIDLILIKDTAYVVDINPRLTSSYIALSESLNLNPMARLLKMKENGFKALQPITQRKTVELIL